MDNGILPIKKVRATFVGDLPVLYDLLRWLDGVPTVAAILAPPATHDATIFGHLANDHLRWALAALRAASELVELR